MARSKSQARQGKQQKKSPKVAAASPKVSSKQGKKTHLTKKQLIQQEKAARKKRDQANRQDVASLFGPLKAGRAASDSPNRNNGKNKRDSPRGKKSPKKNKRVSNVLVDGGPIHARKRQQQRPHGNNYNSRPKPSHFQLRTIQNPKGCEIPWWTDKDRKQFLASSKRASQQQAQQHHYLFGKQPPHEQWLAQLDMELTRFAEYVQLSPVEREARQFIVQTVEDLSWSHLDCAKAKDKDTVRVHVFGSFATLPVCAYCSDVDLAIYGLVPPEDEDEEGPPAAAVARGKHTRFSSDETNSSSNNNTDSKLAKVQKWMSLLEQHDKAVADKEEGGQGEEAVAEEEEEEKKEDGAWQNALDAMLDGANEGPDSPADRKRSDSVVDLTHSPDTPEKDPSKQQSPEDDEDKKPAAKQEPEIIDVDAIPSPPSSSPAKKTKQDQFADASPQQDASVAAFRNNMEKYNNDNDDSNKEGSPDTKQPVRMVSVDEIVAPPSEKASQEEQEDSKPAAKQQEQQQQTENDNSQQENDAKAPARHLEKETSVSSDNVQEGGEVPKPSPSNTMVPSAEDATLGDFFVLDRIGIDEEEEEKKWQQKQDTDDQDIGIADKTEKDDGEDTAVMEAEKRALQADVGEAGVKSSPTELGGSKKRSYSEATDNNSGSDSEEDTFDKLASFQEQNRSAARPLAEGYRSQQAVISLSSDDEDDDDDDEYDNEEEGDEELDDIQVSFVTDPAATSNRNAVGPSGAVRAEVVNVLSSLGSILRRRQFTKSVQVIRKARVPIVKFQTKLGFEGDVAMGGHNGTDTSQFAMSQVERFKSFGTVVMALKIMLWQQGLDTPFHGGLGSYKLYVLVAHHLERHLELGGSDRPGEVFLSFLFRYGQVKRGIGVLDDCHRGARSFLTQHALLECCDGCYSADMSATTLLRHCIDLFRRCFMQVGQEHVYTRAPKKGTSILKALYDIDSLMTERSESMEKAAMFNDFQKGQKTNASNRKQSHRQSNFRGRGRAERPSKRRKS